jgi:hypothetical protein
LARAHASSAALLSFLLARPESLTPRLPAPSASFEPVLLASEANFELLRLACSASRAAVVLVTSTVCRPASLALSPAVVTADDR